MISKRPGKVITLWEKLGGQRRWPDPALAIREGQLGGSAADVTRQRCQAVAGRRGEGQRVDDSERPVDELLAGDFDGLLGPRADEQALQPGDLAGVQIARPDSAQKRLVAVDRALGGDREQHRPAALPEVFAYPLPGLDWISKGAQQVVFELKGLAEQQPGRA